MSKAGLRELQSHYLGCVNLEDYPWISARRIAGQRVDMARLADDDSSMSRGARRTLNRQHPGATTMATTTANAPASKPKVHLTKLFINNEWVDPVDGGEFETYNPATGEVIAKVAAAGPADVDKAVKAARHGPGIRSLEHDGRRRSRPAALQAGRPGRAERRRAGRARIAQLRQDDQRLQGRHAGRLQHAALLRRLGRQDRRPDDPGARQLPVVHACGSRSAWSARSSPGTSRC